VTWLTWPFLAGTPFFLLFGAVYLAARWGTRRASVLAVALGAVGSLWVFTPLGFPAWRAVGGFIVVGGVAALLASETNLVIQALQASEAQFRATWEHAAIGAALLNRDGKVVRINPALERILGHSSDEWIGRRFDRFTHSDDVRGQPDHLARVIDGIVSDDQHEQRWRNRDGGWVWCRVTLSAIRGASSSPASPTTSTTCWPSRWATPTSCSSACRPGMPIGPRSRKFERPRPAAPC
jgi:PAS domain S-box-containing protein